MREPLYRGKRVDNNEWVYGWYAPLVCNDKTIIPNIRDRNGIDRRVIPETIEQYTGLYDKNDRMIFEGDIVNQNRNGFKTLYVVIFTNEDVGSCGCCYPQFDGIGFVFESVKGTRANSFDMYPLEVVGNIYDNKEMLKGQ